MADEHQDSTEQQPTNLPESTIPPIGNNVNSVKEGDKKTAKSGDNDQPKHNSPQPFIVKVDKGKGWSKAEIISLFGILISGSLFFMTLQTFKKTSKAVAISDSTYKRSIIKDNIAILASNKRDSLDSINRLIDSVNTENRFRLDSAGLQAQMNSIKETQRDFANQNRPLIQITDMKIDSVGVGQIPIIRFSLFNTGKFPGKLLNVADTLVLELPEKEREVVNIVLGKGRDPNTSLPNVGHIGITQALNRIITKDGVEAYKSNKAVFYFIIKYKYVSLVTNIQYANYSVLKIKYNLPDVDITAVRNDETPPY